MASHNTNISAEDVRQTFAKLLIQAGTSRASTWSVRTLDRAYHWAILAERLDKRKDVSVVEKPRAKLLFALLENPCCVTAVVEEARTRLEALPEVKDELECRTQEHARLLVELEGALRDAKIMGMSLDDILNLVMAETHIS